MLEINLHVHTNEAQEAEVPKAVITNITQSGPYTAQGFEQAVLQSLARKQYSFAAASENAIAAIDPAGAAAQITAADLDAGAAFEIGKDYYIFAAVENGLSSYAVSANKAYDAGHLVGGFHYGKNRRINENLQPVNASGAERGNGWEANVYDGILPFSLWTLARRPKCDPEGMVRLPTGLWVDIYLFSEDSEGGLVSAYNAMPLTRKSWYDFNELALAKGKRLLSHSEWLQMAIGSPQGLEDDNTNAWTAYRNNGPQKTGYVANAVSSVGCRDAVGNVWEWLDTFTNDPDGGEWEWYDKMPGYGQLFMAGSTGLMALLAGGRWSNAANAGARAVSLDHFPWIVYADFGARGACDSL